MKILTIFFVVGGGMMGVTAQGNAAGDEAAKSVVISTEFINQLVEEARTNNPALRAAHSRVKAATLNAGTVRTWEDPMAMVGGSVFSASGFDPKQEGDLAYGVEEKLPLWARPALNRRVAETEVSRRRAEAELRLEEARRDIAQGLLGAALDEREVEIGEEDLAWLEVTARAVESKYRTGGAVLADTLEIENEASERSDELITERHRLAHDRVALNRLLNRDVKASWPSLQLPAVGPAIPLSQKLVTLSLENEPKLKVMEQEIKEAQAAAELTRQSRLPDVSVGVEGRQYSGDGGFREGDFTLRFSLPWFNSENYRRAYERDKEKENAVEEERKDRILSVQEELHHLSVEMEARRREALLYSGEITERATEALQSRLSDWATGRGLFRDVLDARRALLESESRCARATAEENEMLAEMALGAGLESREALEALAQEPSLIPNHDH